MAQTLSLEGLDILVDGPVLEMVTHGIRTPENGRDAARLFLLLCSDEILGVIFDTRDADYQFDETELRERGRVIARICRGKQIAYIARSDQDEQAQQMLDIHKEMGSESRMFRSLAEARDWMKPEIG